MSIPMSKNNDVTLFSNGIGHFRRAYEAPQGNKEVAISIPFKTDSIGDVAASLQVFGKVKLTAPPSFTPANSNATSLAIQQKEAMKSLLTQLSGSTIELTVDSKTAEYQLLGMDVADGGTDVVTDYVVVMQGGSVFRYKLSDVRNIEFKDESVRTEIEKALKNNYQKIKPDSTLLDLTLEPLEDAKEFSVQYTIPVAAWKMRYAIREEKGNFTLEGAAIIDNNTDEDWNDFRVSVVTGNPISFSTDIANVVVPQRRFVQLVDQTTLGNVQVEEAITRSVRRSRGNQVLAASAGGLESLGPKASLSEYCSFGMEEAADYSAETYTEEVAQHGGVDSKEVGDFCVFTSKEEITILARKSAVVPMFSVPLNHAGVVLLYKEQNHASRPYRAVKFKNETEYSLGKGKTVIYNGGIFSGECVLDATKPGDKRMLPHCLENSVRVSKEVKLHGQQLTSIRVSNGVAIVENLIRGSVVYTLSNKKDQSYKFALEHSYVVGGNDVMIEFEGVELEEQEKLSGGCRAYLALPPNETISLEVTETRLDSSKIQIGNNYNWVFTNLVVSDLHDLAGNQQIQDCVNAQSAIDQVNLELSEAGDRVNELERERQGVREDLRAAESVASGEKLSGWISEIDTAKEEVRQLQKVTIPNLKKQRDDLEAELRTQLSKLSVSWSSPQKTPKEVINQ